MMTAVKISYANYFGPNYYKISGKSSYIDFDSDFPKIPNIFAYI